MLELKAKLENPSAARSKLLQMGAKYVGRFHQTDTYINVPKGRLKLREVKDKTEAELIYYEREDIATPKRSSVSIVPIPQPEVFKKILFQMVEVRNTVRKVREIFMYEGVQIHLDDVSELGYYVEFEQATSKDEDQQKKDILKLERIKELLSIDPRNLEELSYSDLIG